MPYKPRQLPNDSHMALAGRYAQRPGARHDSIPLGQVPLVTEKGHAGCVTVLGCDGEE